MKDLGHISPPKIPLRFLRWFCDPDLLEDVEGDLIELYNVQYLNRRHPKLLFTRDVILLFRPGIIANFKIRLNHHIMLRNYFIVALRNAKKYKGHTLLNLFSLIVGIAACLTMLLWINDEVHIDKFHENDARIYRLWRNMHQGSGEILTTGAIPQPLAVKLREGYSEVDEVSLVGWDFNLLFRHGNEVSYETGKYVSPEFLSIFSFPLIEGDQSTALDDISSVIICESLATKYFGTDWRSSGGILGRTIALGDDHKEFVISGVAKDPGSNSSIDFDWLINAREYISRNDWVESWFNGGFSMIFTLADGADITEVQKRVLQEVNENTDHAADERIFVNRFSDNYLYSTFESGVPVSGRIQYVRIMAILAVFILIIACINYMNLATARSSRRSKEIGVRKVLGARKASLRSQFYTEAFVMSLAAVMVALLVVRLILPYFNTLTEKELALDVTDGKLWLGVLVVTILTSLLSGSYPAVMMPSFETIASLKGTGNTSKKGIRLREGLVVFQFALSILLIIGTLIVGKQIQYILNKNLGLDKENVAYVRMPSTLRSNMDLYGTELRKIPQVLSATATSGNPLDYGRSSGSAQWSGKDPAEEVEINVLHADTNFVKTMAIEVVNGRDFSGALSTDTANYLINEVTASIMGFDNPVGQELTLWGDKGKVIGVVKNFHMGSMYEPIAPLIIRNDASSTNIMLIRLQGDVQQAVRAIEGVSTSIDPDHPFMYGFLDQEFEAAYRGEMTLNTIARIFALISILIACFGLFGLSSFSADQRSREIGIRKVYGASVQRIVSMLTWGYTKLVLVAFLIAAPLSAYVMSKWLNNFEFRTNLTITVFIVAGIVTLMIGAMTVALKSWQAARANPLQTLHEE